MQVERGVLTCTGLLTELEPKCANCPLIGSLLSQTSPLSRLSLPLSLVHQRICSHFQTSFNDDSAGRGHHTAQILKEPRERERYWWKTLYHEIVLWEFWTMWYVNTSFVLINKSLISLSMESCPVQTWSTLLSGVNNTLFLMQDSLIDAAAWILYPHARYFHGKGIFKTRNSVLGKPLPFFICSVMLIQMLVQSPYHKIMLCYTKILYISSKFGDKDK